MAKINVFKDRNGNVIYQRPVLTPSTKKAEDLLKKTAQKAPKIDTSPRNYGKPVTEKVQIVDYQSPIDTSPRNYGRPLTNKPHFGLYDDEKSLSNVTLGDVTYKPLLSGYYGQKMNEAIGVNRLSGNTNMNTPQIAKYQGLAQKFEPTRFSNPNAPFGGMLNNAPGGALSLIGQQAANLTDEDTVMYAGTGAAAGAMIGSVAGLPGSAISAASGLKAGIAAGVGKNMFEAVYGGTYRDLMDAGVSDSTAHKTALISAGVQSALEMVQLDELAKAAKLLRKQNKAVLAEGIEKILIDRGKGVLKNTGEEMAQEVVAISGEHYAKSKEGLPTDSLADNVNRIVETGVNTALSMGLISLPGAVSTGNQALQYDKDQKRAQEYIDSLKVAMIKNGITPRSEQPQGTLGPLAAQAANQTPLNSTLITPQDLGNAAIADAKNNWTPGQVRYQNNLYTPPGREKTMTAERKEQSRRQAIQYAKRANIDIVFRDLEEGEGHFEGKFEKYDGKNILNPKGRITINNNSYDPFRVVFIHEFTHAMELSKEHYNKYANFAIVNLLPYKYGTSDIAELADAKAKFYASQGVRLTSEEARQEIVSELTSEYMFRDYQAIENLFRYNENIFYWMFENIKNWVKSFAGTQEEQDLARAYKLYARVLKEHQKRPNVVKAAQESVPYVNLNENALNQDETFEENEAASSLKEESGERYSFGKLKATNSGYDGYSMSKRATEAYEDGKKPLSKFNSKDLAMFNKTLEDNGIKSNVKTVKQLRELLDKKWSGEWHHTSIYGNQTKFHKLEDIMDLSKDRESIINSLPEGFEVIDNKKIGTKTEYDYYDEEAYDQEMERQKSIEEAMQKRIAESKNDDKLADDIQNSILEAFTIDELREAWKNPENRNGNKLSNNIFKSKGINVPQKFDVYYSKQRGIDRVKRNFINDTDKDLGGDEAIVKFSLKTDDKGSYVNVDTDQDIFEGASRKNVPKVAQDYMNKRFKNEILDGVKVDSKGINKMTHPGNSQPLFVQKMRAMTELDNIIKASVFVDSEKATKDSAKYPEYEYYGFNFKLSGQWFNGILNIGLDGDGQRHLYEINKIYHGRRPYEGFTLQERIEATMADSINNNIPTNEQDVNIETEKKYSDEDGTKFSLKKTDAKNIARKIKADYGSKSTIKDISQELTEIYDMDVNDMMAVNQRIEDLATRIAENVPTVNEFEQRIKEFRQAVRNMPIRVDDNIKADIADYGAWSKRYFNRLNLSADGRNIDELYDSLAAQFPEFLEADITNPSDQLMAIAEALDTTREDRGYSNNEDMMYDILLDIYDDYYRYQADEQAKAAEEPIFEPGDDGPGNNGPTDDGDAYGEYDGDTSLARIDVWEHTEPEDRSPYFEKGENPARDINVPQRDEYGRKVSRFTRTAAESRALDDEQASELNESVWNGTFSYNVITDQDAINRANDKMERFDNDTLLNGLESKLYDSKIITKDDIALGERLIQEYAKEKDVDNLERAIAVVATAGTRAGQAVQAMRLLKKLSPAGQLMALQKQIDTINTDMKLLGDKKVTLSPERAKDITSSDTPEGLEQAVERAKMELYNKVPSRWVDKWNAWRYLSMLGNPKTHIRNVLGNAIFVPVRGMKNVIGATIEAATVKGERSKAIGKLPKVFKEFAAKEFDANREVIDAGGKENIERNKRVFKSSILEGMRKANSFALEAEDQKFLKAAYVRSFAGYLKANKISPALVQKLMSGKGTDIEIGDAATAKIFNNARAYAMNEAQKATYRDYSALANALNKFKKTNAVTAVLGEGLMPFTKTPINILKRGVEYSPVGILKGIKELTNDVKKADDDMKQQTILKGIDSMASGLSGTAILALGAFLASQGILSGGGEDDKKERDMAAMMGSQNYSFNMGDVSYTVDWMAPVSLPLFVGVELFNSLESGTVNGFVDIADAMTSISEPMVNMSMLQGLNRAVTNFDQKDALTSTATDMALGYFSQGVPTLSGQFARTMDATRRTAYVDKNNDIPDTLERPMLNAAAKVPGLSKKLNPYRDSFGRPQRNDSTLMRAFENFVSPGYVKVKKNDMVLNELQKVYGRTGDKGVLPSLPNKKIGDKNLTAKEYDSMAYMKGKTAYGLIDDIRKTDGYKDAPAADQAKMISDAYSYAYEMAKDNVLGVKPDGWIAKAADAEKKHDIPVETYITYNNYKNSLKGEGTKAKFIDKIQSDDSLTQKQKDKLDDYWYGSIEASKITELSNAEQRQWNVAKEYGFDEDKFSKYVGYITQQGEGKTKMNNINDAVKAGLPRGEAVLLYNIMRQKKYRYNG